MSDVDLPAVRCLIVPSDALFTSVTPLQVMMLERPSPDEYAALLRDLVTGPLREVCGPVGSWFYCNANAFNLGQNAVATRLAREAGTLSFGHVIAGQVVVVGEPDTRNNDTSVPDLLLETLRGLGCEIAGEPIGGW
jgi:hypothetical protein